MRRRTGRKQRRKEGEGPKAGVRLFHISNLLELCGNISLIGQWERKRPSETKLRPAWLSARTQQCAQVAGSWLPKGLQAHHQVFKVHAQAQEGAAMLEGRHLEREGAGVCTCAGHRSQGRGAIKALGSLFASLAQPLHDITCVDRASKHALQPRLAPS